MRNVRSSPSASAWLDDALPTRLDGGEEVLGRVAVQVVALVVGEQAAVGILERRRDLERVELAGRQPVLDALAAGSGSWERQSNQ